MSLSALPPLSALRGEWPPGPKSGKLVTMGVTGRQPSGDTSISRVVGSRDICRTKCRGGEGQVTCSLVPQLLPHVALASVPRKQPRETPCQH